MDRFKIHGGKKLQGTVQISGAKNAALPAMAAALLTSDPVTLQNIPRVRDIITMAKLLAHMRCQVSSPDLPPSEFTIRAENVSMQEAPYELVKTMRASVLTLGPLVARFGHAKVSLPGGCAIGARPVDLHIQALEALGAETKVEHGYVEARAKRLRGTTFRFPKITVTGTENILTAAVLAERSVSFSGWVKAARLRRHDGMRAPRGLGRWRSIVRIRKRRCDGFSRQVGLAPSQRPPPGAITPVRRLHLAKIRAALN